MISTPALKTAVHGAPSAEQVGRHAHGSADAAESRGAAGDGRRADHRRRSRRSVSARSARSTARCCPPARRTCSIGASRRTCRCWPASTAARSVRSPSLAPPAPASAAAYESAIRERYGDLADEFLRLYPRTNMQESIFATTRDALYGWTAERLVRKQTALGVPSYLYLFDHGYPAADEGRPARLPRQRAALRVRHLRPHAAALAEESGYAAKSMRFADAMGDYWTSFAQHGSSAGERCA